MQHHTNRNDHINNNKKPDQKNPQKISNPTWKKKTEQKKTPPWISLEEEFKASIEQNAKKIYRTGSAEAWKVANIKRRKDQYKKHKS